MKIISQKKYSVLILTERLKLRFSNLHLLVLLHTLIIYTIQNHYQEKSYKNEVRNTVLSMLRIGNNFFSKTSSKPDSIVYQTHYDPNTQSGEYNVIFKKVQGAIEINTAFIDHEKLKQLEQLLYKNSTLALTSRMQSGKHKWFTLYVSIKHSDEMFILLGLNVTIHLIIIALLIFLLYITRYIFPKIIFDHASGGLSGKGALPIVPDDMAEKLNGLKQQVDRLIHEKTFVVASMSHDMRNALAKLQLLVHFIKDKETADNMMAELNEIQMIIDSSLAFSEGGARNRAETFSIYDYMNDLQAYFIRRGYQFSYKNLLPQETKIQGYPALLKRGISNVINNAVKYAEHYEVSCTVDQNYILIAVTDDGPGVTKAQLTKINTPYQRSVEAIESDVEGYGLGLAITKAAIEFHKGQLSYHNVKPHGFKVVMSLPVRV